MVSLFSYFRLVKSSSAFLRFLSALLAVWISVTAVSGASVRGFLSEDFHQQDPVFQKIPHIQKVLFKAPTIAWEGEDEEAELELELFSHPFLVSRAAFLLRDFHPVSLSPAAVPAHPAPLRQACPRYDLFCQWKVPS